jgi:hypothetical protein
MEFGIWNLEFEIRKIKTSLGKIQWEILTVWLNTVRIRNVVVIEQQKTKLKRLGRTIRRTATATATVGVVFISFSPRERFTRSNGNKAPVTVILLVALVVLAFSSSSIMSVALLLPIYTVLQHNTTQQL